MSRQLVNIRHIFNYTTSLIYRHCNRWDDCNNFHVEKTLCHFPQVWKPSMSSSVKLFCSCDGLSGYQLGLQNPGCIHVHWMMDNVRKTLKTVAFVAAVSFGRGICWSWHLSWVLEHSRWKIPVESYRYSFVFNVGFRLILIMIWADKPIIFNGFACWKTLTKIVHSSYQGNIDIRQTFILIVDSTELVYSIIYTVCEYETSRVVHTQSRISNCVNIKW